MRRTLALYILAGLAATLVAAFAWAQEAPAPSGLAAPTGLTVSADPKDNEGTKFVLKWKPPQGAPPAGLELAGYLVYQRQDVPGSVGHAYAVLMGLKIPEPGAWDVADLVEGGDQAEDKIDGLESWPSPFYHYAVAAVYLPTGAKWKEKGEGQEDYQGPKGVATEGLQEARSAEVGPVRPEGKWFNRKRTNVGVTSALYTLIVILALIFARRRDMYIRPIAGLQAVDDAIGRATEMGRPLLFVSGLTGVGDVSTIAAMLILGHLSRRTAAYETPVLAPCNDPMVMSITREIVHEAYLEAGKPDAYDPDNIFYVTDSQFGYVAAVDGIMLREKPAANFYMGYFYAESLILAETGNQSGAIQIAGTDADTQLPFFITACDYTLMGEELYAAGAYLSRDPILLAQLKGQDLGKAIISLALIVATAIASIAVMSSGKVPPFVEWFNTK